MSRSFAARFISRCCACDERIYEGDLIRFNDDGYYVIHDDCEAAAPVERPVQPMCPTCFTELPIAGGCGVCD